MVILNDNKIREVEVVVSNTNNFDKTTSVRNYGIDALRLLAMFFVCAIHVLENGGLLKSVSGLKYDITWLVEVVVFCAVNCYAIISGYVSYSEKEKTYRFSKYITLWLSVFFYSFGINLLVFLIKGSKVVSISSLLMSALPVTSSLYWYFSAYTGVFFVIPLLNKFVRSLNKKQLTAAIILIFVVFSCYGFLFNVFYMSDGYSFVWLAILYLFGAWLKKCEIPQKIKGTYAMLGIVVCVLITWVFKITSPVFNGLLVSYISPTIVIMAVCYVIVFSRLKINNIVQKTVKYMAPAAFGVYIIHLQDVVANKFINNKFIWISNLDWWAIPLAVFGIAFAIFIVCLIIERIRLSVFDFLKINKFAENICYKIELFLRKYISKICDHICD